MGSRRLDVLSLAQLRKDGRRPNEIRRVKIELGCVMNDSCSTGSCLFEMGLTSVLASVMGPTECSRRSEELPDRASVSVQVRMAPFASSSTAMERRIINPTTDRKLLEPIIDAEGAASASSFVGRQVGYTIADVVATKGGFFSKLFKKK